MSRRDYTPGSSGGVTTLMYVGDADQAIDGQPSQRELGWGLVGLAAVIWGRGIVRLAGAGVAAYVGRRAYLANRR